MERMKDSGKRQTFMTGAVCDTDDGKPRPDLVSPFAMERIGLCLAVGAKKYGERNYEAGIPLSRRVASLYRHLIQYQMRDFSEDHLASIAANSIMILHVEECVRRGLLPPSLLDLPKYRRPDSYEGTPKIVVRAEGPKISFEAHDTALAQWETDGGK